MYNIRYRKMKQYISPSWLAAMMRRTVPVQAQLAVRTSLLSVGTGGGRSLAKS